MRSSLFLMSLGLLLVSGPALGQSIKKHDMQLTTLQLPLHLLPPDIQSYAPKLIPNGVPIMKLQGISALGGKFKTRRYDEYGRVVGQDKTQHYVNEFMVLKGYARDNENPDMLLEVEFGEVDLKNIRLHDNRVILDGTGRTNYYYTMLFQMPAIVRLRRTADSALFLEKKVGIQKNVEFTGTGVVLEIPAFARQVFLKERENFIRENISGNLETLFFNVIREANSQYGYLDYLKNIRLYSAKRRKMDYSDLDQAIAKVEEAHRLRTADPRGDDWKGPLQEAIGLWRAALAQADEGNKKARINEKVARHLEYNIAIGLIWLDAFEEAETYLARVEQRGALRSRIKVARDHSEIMAFRAKSYAEALAAGPVEPKGGVSQPGALVRYFDRQVEDWQVEGFKHANGDQIAHAVLWTRFQTEGQGRTSRGRLKVEIPVEGNAMRICFAHRDQGWSSHKDAIEDIQISIPFVQDFAMTAAADDVDVCSTEPVEQVVDSVLRGRNNGDLQLRATGDGNAYEALQSLQGFPLALLTANILVSGQQPLSSQELERSSAYQRMLAEVQ